MGFLLTNIAPKTAESEEKIRTIYEKANTWLKGLLELCKISEDSVYFKPTEKNMFCVHAGKSAMKTMETTLKSIKEKGEYKNVSFKYLTSAGRIEDPALDRFQEQLDSAKAIFSRCLNMELQPVCIQYITSTRHLWQDLETWVLNLDLALAIAKTSKEHGWVKPEIETTEGPSRIAIKNLRHPLIEIQKRQSKYVTHDVELGVSTDQGWLLYGMNASGKSSLMKAIGLATLLAQVGSYVPATSMVLRPFHKLATRILNQDNLWAGLSSFAVEMSELREILSVADEHTLVLGDELCAGTESISGTAIVAAGIQHLYKCGSRFVLATHLHDLMKLDAIISLQALKVWHLHVEYDPIKDLLIYNRSLRPGPGSSMYGLEVAKALHLPADMIEMAFAMRRILLGSVATEDTKASSWNSDITLQSCSACGCKIESKLEVHHLQERSEAKGDRNRDGTALNHIRNLAVLCDSCHDKHHSGLLHIGEIEDTSEGPKRKIIDLSEFSYKATEKGGRKIPFTDEQLTIIQKIVKEYPGLTSKLWCFKIRNEAEIEITEVQFKNLQKKGLL